MAKTSAVITVGTPARVEANVSLTIRVEFIPHGEQRYNTVGDWFLTDGELCVRVSQMADARYSALVLLHELVEVLVASLKQSSLLPPQWLVTMVDKYDREAPKNVEPGYSPDCPVYEAHMIASAVEHLAAMLVGVDYNLYEREIDKLVG